MVTQSPKKILIIGSYGHAAADACVGWRGSFPYLGDYHLIIIDLQSLYESAFDDAVEERFSQIRNQINEIIWANSEIVCITAPTMTKGGSIEQEGKHFPSMSNYHWCPIYLSFVKQSGESFEKKPKGGYFDFVKKWTHFLDLWNMGPYRLQKRAHFTPRFDDLLTNLAKRRLSFRLRFAEYDMGEYDMPVSEVVSNPITFLPPPTEISIKGAIDYLLKQERGIRDDERMELPEWSEKILVAGEEKTRREIEERKALSKQLEGELEAYDASLSEIIRYKALLTEEGEGLENIVEKTFKVLNVKTKPGPKLKEDRIIVDSSTGEEIPMEIASSEKSIPERKLNQLIGRLTDERRPEKTKCRGVLVGNHYRTTPLDELFRGRKAPFEPDIIKKAKMFDICIVSTLELFKAVNAKLQGEEITYFVSAIFDSPGEARFGQYEGTGPVLKGKKCGDQ